MYRLDYKGVRGKRAVAHFNTIEQAQAWVHDRLRRGITIVNPRFTKES